VREAFRRRGEEFDASLARSLRRRGVDVIRLETDRPYVEPLLAFFRMREQLQQR
jgi:uncharacterized protein (DUF58 family)